MFTKSKYFKMILSLILLVVLITGCAQNQGKVKGVKERKKMEAEPEITIKFPSGEKKDLKLEEYITGVVAGEMEKDWPENAYGAQAILARTFALKYMEQNQTDVISSSFEYAQEYKPENITDIVRSAVKKNRGEVALYKDDYIKGWFHASAGGKTTSAKVGLAYEDEEPLYIKAVKSPDQESPADIKEWTVSFSDSEILNALKKSGKNIGTLKNIEIINKDDSGRAIEFKFIGSKTVANIKAANFRNELDPKKLKSIKISKLEKKDNNYIFTGSGYGHGVGMSQWGAFAMAKEGKSSKDIVEYYFKDIEVVKVYD